MADRSYRATVEVVLSDTLDEGPLAVLSSILLGALSDAEVAVTAVRVEACDG